MNESLINVGIQHSYFAILEYYFEKSYAEMKRHKVGPRGIAEQLASNKVPRIGDSADFAEKLNLELGIFWTGSESIIQKYLNKLNHRNYFASIYGGDISSSCATTIARSVNLYVDAILWLYV